MLDSQLNVYHLQLLNEIAEHGGITAAAKNNHGPSQSTLSGHIAELEGVLGGKLFHRQPFQLTALGKRWCEPARLFFQAIHGLRQRTQQDPSFTFRLGASQHVLSHYILDVLHLILQQAGEIQFDLETPRANEVYARLTNLSLDIAITPLYGEIPQALEAMTLMSLSPVLLVPNTEKYAHIRTAADLLKRGDIEWMMVRPLPDEPLAQIFDQELQARGIRWRRRTQVANLELVTTLVKQGAGIGLSVSLPTLMADPGVRVLKLPGFALLKYGLLWNRATREYCAPLRQAVQASAGTRFKVGADGKLVGLRGNGQGGTGAGADFRTANHQGVGGLTAHFR